MLLVDSGIGWLNMPLDSNHRSEGIGRTAAPIESAFDSQQCDGLPVARGQQFVSYINARLWPTAALASFRNVAPEFQGQLSGGELTGANDSWVPLCKALHKGTYAKSSIMESS